MIKPPELASEAPFGSWSCRGCDVWDAICAAVAGDAEALRRLLERDPNLYRAGYWYTPPIHFAVREGHLEAVRVLLEAGADPAAVGLSGESLITVARDRGHETVARLLEEVRAERGRTTPDLAGADHAIHLAAAAGDVAQVEKLLDADPQLLHRGDGQGGTPLHRAVGASAREVIELLRDRGRPRGPRAGEGSAGPGSRPHRGGTALRQAGAVRGRRVRPRGHRENAAGPWRRSELAGRSGRPPGDRPLRRRACRGSRDGRAAPGSRRRPQRLHRVVGQRHLRREDPRAARPADGPRRPARRLRPDLSGRGRRGRAPRRRRPALSGRGLRGSARDRKSV